MGLCSYLTESKVVTASREWALPFPSRIALENSMDAHHTPWVHWDTVKSYAMVAEHGAMSLVLFELIPIPLFRFYTRKFLALRMMDDAKGEAHFLFLPVSTGLASLLTIQAARPGTIRHLFRLRLSGFWRPFAGLLLYLRNRAEDRRWKQDMELMTERHRAVQSGHRDNPKCLDNGNLIRDWFGVEIP